MCHPLLSIIEFRFVDVQIDKYEWITYGWIYTKITFNKLSDDCCIKALAMGYSPAIDLPFQLPQNGKLSDLYDLYGETATPIRKVRCESVSEFWKV